jgi:S1-C subfamily serine protease/predicted esterase
MASTLACGFAKPQASFDSNPLTTPLNEETLMPCRYILTFSIFIAVAVSHASAQDDLNARLEKMVKEAVKKASGSVVQIVTQGGSDVVVTDPKKGTIFRKALGPTTGVIVGSDGYIITSTYNFINNPTTILVNLPDRTEPLIARKVANDKSRMLTLIKVDASALPVPPAVPKKDMQEGQWSIALGRTLDAKRGAPPSISLGVISARNRIWGKAIQTDAKVSPINYGGPLVDIYGNVQGIIIPASPFVEDVTAGFEWYDSGIGFAVPMEDVYAALPRLKLGKDLERGTLGINLKNQDLYAAVPEISGVLKGSTADRAKLQAGDIITEIDGQPITRLAQLKQILGAKYEGDKISLKFKRGIEEKSADDLVLLSTALVAAHPYMGVLPMRDDPALGMEIRYVFPGSPADTAGLKAGDRIVQFGGPSGNLFPFTGLKRGRAQLAEWLNGQVPGADVRVEVRRKDGGKTETVTLTLDQIPGSRPATDATVPEKLPQPASVKKGLAPLEQLNPAAKVPMVVDPKAKPDSGKPPKAGEPKAANAETGTFKRTTADGQNTYWVHVPKAYDANIAHALVVWLHPPGKFKEEDVDEFVDQWEEFAKDQHMILLMPLTLADSGWVPSDAAFVAEAMNAVIKDYAIDRSRVVTHGMGVGGQMAIYLGFTERDLVRGVATIGAVVTQVVGNARDKRLSFYLAGGAVDPVIKSIAESRVKLAEKSYPVIYREIPNRGREYFDELQLREVARWIDMLDRL